MLPVFEHTWCGDNRGYEKDGAFVEKITSVVPSARQYEHIRRKYYNFIHFGLNTMTGQEWGDGTVSPAVFHPDQLDTDQWCEVMKATGSAGIILTAKHHDGFCLWDTKTTDYNVMNSPFGRDIVRMLAESCKKYHLKLGIYLSPWDRHEKTYGSDAYNDFYVRQLTELMDGRYGEIVELWLDGSWDKSCAQWRLDLIYDLVKRLQPKCQIGVNHTVGVYSEEAGGPEERYQPKNYQEGDPLRMFPSDFRLWDPHMCRADDPKIYTFGGQEYYMPFEMTICSRDGFSWFYSNIYEKKPLMNVDEVVRNCETLFAQGNLAVINMPPDVHGRLVEGDVANLMEIARRLGRARV